MAMKPSHTFREATKSRKTEAIYRRSLETLTKKLRAAAEKTIDPNDPASAQKLEALFLWLANSGELDAWARRLASRVLRRVEKDDYSVWMRSGDRISAETRRLLKEAGEGAAFQRLMEEQVELIKSIPQKAAEKVHQWATEGMVNGDRYLDIAERIKGIGKVTDARATCIARTEVARSRSNFTKARAQAVGSHYYVWHTVGDGSVRDSHAALDGKVFRWDDPPVTDYGKGGEPIRSNPGCVFNCRCWAQPLFDEDLNL